MKSNRHEDPEQDVRQFNRCEEDIRKFLAGKVESLIRDRSGPRGRNGIDRHIEELSESGPQRRAREHEEAVIKFLAEAALAGEFAAEYDLQSSPTSEQGPSQHDVRGNETHGLENSTPSEPEGLDKEVISIYASEDAPTAPHRSPRKRNWHKKDIPSWNDDDQAVYGAICIHLNIGKEGYRGRKVSGRHRCIGQS